MPLNIGLFRLLTSAATVLGFKAQNLFGSILTLTVSPQEREQESSASADQKIIEPLPA